MEKNKRQILILVFAFAQVGSCLAAEQTHKLLPADNLESFRLFSRSGGMGKVPKGVFKLDQGTLKTSGSEAGFLISKRKFRNFSLIVEYRWQSEAADRDSGVFVNTVEKGGKFTALECDIPGPKAGLPGRLWLFGPGEKKMTSGGKTIVKQGVAPSQAKSLEKPTGEWNTMEVLCRDGAFEIRLNGQTTVRGHDPTPPAGAIMLQSSKGGIQFRRLEVTDFDAGGSQGAGPSKQ